MAAVLALVVAAFGFGFADGFGSEASAEPAVQAFLLDWQQGRYAQAAALTDGGAGQVTAELAAAYTDVDATNAFFSLKSVTQHGSTAVAEFQATVDLAQSGQQWTYTGRFLVTSSGGQWTIHWTPSLINPSLAAGDRLAAVTTFPQRAQITDMNGQPLVTESADYQVGVYPDRLTNEAATAAKFSAVTGLDQQQVLGQIQAAPPDSFLSLLTLQAGSQPDSFTAAVAEAGQGAGPRLHAADAAAVRFGRAADGRRGRDGGLAGAAGRGRRLPARHDRGAVRP